MSKSNLSWWQNPAVLWNRFLVTDVNLPDQMFLVNQGIARRLDPFASLIWLACAEPRAEREIQGIAVNHPSFSGVPARSIREASSRVLHHFRKNNLITLAPHMDRAQCSALSSAPKMGKLKTLPTLVKASVQPPPHLFAVSWNWTNICNFNCVHCYSRGEHYSKELTTAESLDAANQMYEMGVFSVQFGGGECLLRDDFFEVLGFLKARTVPCQLSSNGYLFSDETAERLASVGLDKLNFSLDSYKAEIHDEIRLRPGSHQKVIRSIDLAKSKGLTVNLLSMLTKPNLPWIQPLIDLARSHRVDEITFKVVKKVGNARQNSEIIPPPEELRRTYEFLKEAALKYKNEIKVNYGRESEPLAGVLDDELPGEDAGKNDQILYEKSGCSCGDTSLCIKPNGDVTPCSYMTLAVGNVKDEHLYQIWKQSPLLTALRCEKQKPPEMACNGCSSFKRCHGGCIAQTFAERGPGDYESHRDPNCWKIEHIDASAVSGI